MAGFDEAFLHEVRERNDIVSVVSDYVTLQKAGTSMKGLCPFHGEKTASFHVHADRQFFYCFGCQAGGDVFTFIREINGYSFMEAVRHLAERASMPLPEQKTPYDPQKSRVRRQRRDHAYEINALASSFYQGLLHTTAGTQAREYLRGRDISRESIEKFQLGYAPAQWDGLLQHLESERVDLGVAERLGLIVRRKQGAGYYDRFRDRLMFPIRNIAGEVIAFSGRALSQDPETPKYVNSPESPLYHKGRSFYGIHEARTAMRQRQRVILVEGNVDLVRLSQEGFNEVVAPLGTALTSEQSRILARFVPKIVAVYDGDRAGRAAARKAAELAIHEGMALVVVRLPEGDDPDSYLKREGAEAFARLCDEGLPAWEFVVAEVLEETQAHGSARGASAAIEVLRPLLQAMVSPAERQIYIRQLAETLRLDDRVIRTLVSQQGRRQQGPPPEESSAIQGAPVSILELKVLEALLLIPEARPAYLGRDLGEYLTDPRVQEAAERICELDEQRDGQVEVAELVGVVEDGRLKQELMKRLTLTEVAAGGWQGFETLVSQLQRVQLGRELEALRNEERRAWLAKDDERALSLTMQKAALERKLEALKRSDTEGIQ